MRGDLALPLEEVWRVATEEAGTTMGNEQARGRACRIFPGMTKHTELLRDTIHDYDEGIDPTSSPHPPKQDQKVRRSGGLISRYQRNMG